MHTECPAYIIIIDMITDHLVKGRNYEITVQISFRNSTRQTELTCLFLILRIVRIGEEPRLEKRNGNVNKQ
jgi:hypothetical protein